MKRSILSLILVAPLGIAALAAAPASRSRAVREVAVTFDDLPTVSVARSAGQSDEAAAEAMTRKLVGLLSSNRVPTVAFVNEGKLGPAGSPDPRRVALLRRWIDAGIELGNHTFGHLDFHRVPLRDFQDDVARGEAVTRGLAAARGGRLRWFRHPYLHTGARIEDKRALDEYLEGRGYRVAPVTIDNSEWIYAKAYANALEKSDATAARRIGAAYVPYMGARFDYFERQSRDLFGREIRQVLLVHANSLNADRFGDVLRVIRQRGYSLITLDRALEDPVYAESLDTFAGRGGISWLHRWALSSGRRPLAGEPRVPKFVLDAAGLTEE